MSRPPATEIERDEWIGEITALLVGMQFNFEFAKKRITNAISRADLEHTLGPALDEIGEAESKCKLAIERLNKKKD